MNVSLRNITKDNFEAVGSLEVYDHQKKLLASNMLSIAEAQFFSFYVPKAIYSDENPIGFLMYTSLAHEGQIGTFLIFRFMVAAGYQGEGMGSAAMQLVIDEISRIPNANKILICYADDNERAWQFYKNFGFIETGPDPEDEDEIMAELLLSSKDI